MLTIRRLAALTLAFPALASAQTPAPPPTTAPPPMTTPAPMPTAPSAVPAPVVTLPGPTAPASADCGPACEEPAAEPERFLVEKMLGRTCGGQRLLDNGWRIYGWTQGSFTTGSVRRSTLPVPFIDRAEQLSLNQNWLHVEKGVDTSKKEFQIGGAADLILPGTDARFTIARGLLNSQLGRDYPIDLYQAYLDFFAPNVGPQGTIFRVGKFNTNCEYEVVQAISTPFISRSYTFQYNPFTHTGVNAITALDDDWSMSNGLVVGSDNFIDRANRLTYIGHLAWAPKEGKSTAAFNVVVTNPRFDPVENFAFYNAYNLQFTHKICDDLQYVLDTTFSHMDNVTVNGVNTSANWYGFANYLLYDVCDKWQAKARLEFFEDSKGVRTGAAGLYTALTLGATWKPTPWLWVLPEVRYDHHSNGRPFERNQDMFTATIGGLVRW